MSSWISINVFDSPGTTPQADPEGNKTIFTLSFLYKTVETKGLLGSIADSVKSKLSFATTVASTLYNKNYKYFVVAFGAGAVLIVLSFMFLPLVVLFPQKFCLFFSIGSLSILVSFAFLQDPTEYLKSLFIGQNAAFSICYIVSLIISLYASVIAKLYILTLLATALQVVSLVWFVCSKFPGGMQGISMINSCVVSVCKGAFNKLL